MAQGKKSFIAYADWKNIFDELPNEDAGKLIKHIFAYVNDENPISDSILIKAVFANIKNTLKRDLEKWDTQLIQRKEAGKKSAEQRALTKFNERSTVVNEPQRNSTDSVSVPVSDSDTVNEKKKKKTKVFAPPTFNDVLNYAIERKQSHEFAKKFYDYFTAGNWVDSKGVKVSVWKQKFITWEDRQFNKAKEQPQPEKLVKFIDHGDGRTYTCTEAQFPRRLADDIHGNIERIDNV